MNSGKFFVSLVVVVEQKASEPFWRLFFKFCFWFALFFGFCLVVVVGVGRLFQHGCWLKNTGCWELAMLVVADLKDKSGEK